MSYDGFTVSLGYSKVTASVAPCVFLGEMGALTLDRINATSAITLHPRVGEAIALRYETESNNMVYELRDFAALIARGEYEHAWQAPSDITMDILDAIRASAGICFS